MNPEDVNILNSKIHKIANFINDNIEPKLKELENKEINLRKLNKSIDKLATQYKYLEQLLDKQTEDKTDKLII